MRFFCVALLALGAFAAPYRELGKFETPYPCFFLNLNLSYNNPTASSSILITSFNGLVAGHISVIEDSPKQFSGNISSIKPENIISMNWPNIPSLVPEAVIPSGGKTRIVIGDGFLVPGHATGNVYIVSIGSGTADKVALATPKTSWFYHMAVWRDMNNDGHLDVLTARANANLKRGELIWLRNPGGLDPFASVPWKESVITEGPDVLFSIAETSDALLVYAAQFFTSKLVVYSLDLKTPTLKFSHVIDDTIGPLYTAQLVDLNADGKQDLLVTNHDGNESVSAVYAYEIPSVPTGNYKRHLVASGYRTTEPGPPGTQASPGIAYPFWPRPSNATGPPSILLAGDGSQSAYLITPKSTNFEYTQDVIIDVHGTLAALLVADYNNDGWTDFLVPDFDRSYVLAYTFAP